MEYTDDKKQIADWTPLVMEGRTDDEPVAATRIVTGTDVDYGSLTNHFVDHLSTLPGFAVHYLSRVTNISRENNGRWRVEVEDAKSADRRSAKAKFVFIGAGGDALPLLQKSGIPESQRLWRLSGQRHLAALRRPRNQQAPSCEGLWKSPLTARRRCRCHTSILG